MSELRVANLVFDSTSTNKIGYHQDSIVRITSTGALKVPTGTVALRPAVEPGLFRYNTDTASFEFRDSIQWTRLETKTTSTAFPSGGQTGDVWYRI